MTNIVDHTKYYDQRWEIEQKANLWAMHRAGIILQELSKLDIKTPRILDFGCGSGWMTEILSQFGHAEGVDLAPEPAMRFHPTLSFHDVNHIPPEQFDIVISQEVIEHAENQDEYVAIAHSKLRTGGFLILTTPNAAVSLKHPEFLIQPLERHLTKRQLGSLLSRHFEVKKLYSFFYGYARWRPYRMQIRFGKILNAGLHLIAVCRRLQPDGDLAMGRTAVS